MQVDLTPYKEALIKRRAQASTVIVFKSSDPKRLKPFLLFINSYYEKKARKYNEEYRILLYKVRAGLFEVQVDANGNVMKRPIAVTMQMQQSPLARAISSMAQQMRIRDLGTAMNYIDDLFETKSNICVVFWGIRGRSDIRDDFIDFVRNAIFSDEYYSKGHMVVIFTSDPEGLLDLDTLKHCIVIDIPPSKGDERYMLLKQLAEQLGFLKYGIIGEKELHELSEIMRGLTLHEVEYVSLESAYKYKKFDARALTEKKIEVIKKYGIIIDIVYQGRCG